MLSAQLHSTRATFTLDLQVEVPAGSTLALVGESGSGKTTALRVIAGLRRPDRGRISWRNTPWFDADGRIEVPAWQRPVSYVAQDYALFPHLSVFENIAFGLRAQRKSSVAVRERVGAELARFHITDLAERKPHQLSGGQQQRVALARALALDPAVLLLDEPLSALDLRSRRTIRSELRTVLRSLTCATVYVTHSPMEALVFGDRITVLADGHASQSGTPEQLLRHPRSSFVAEFMGVNFFQGRIVGRDDSGVARFRSDMGDLAVMDLEPAGDEAAFVAVSPHEITLHRQPPDGSARNVFMGRVTEMVPEPPHGERIRVALATRPPLVAEITRQAAHGLNLAEGTVVYASFKATGVVPYR
jgi:molybdate transport system ATP-binding protein